MEDPGKPIRPNDFTARELEVLSLIASGLTNREIAAALHLSFETVKWYAKQLYARLGVKNRAQASRKAAEHGLLDPSTQPAKSKRDQNHNLPADVNHFIGRKEAISEVRRLVRENRLVTLTGPGGVGKTRLAVEAARGLLGDFEDGIWLVKAVDLTEAGQLLPAIARATGFVRREDVPLEEGLHHYLAPMRLCLLIDNLEHILPAASSIADLLAQAPALSILATSRERLNLYGEVEYRVPLMETPAASPASIRPGHHRTEAIDLFVDRAQRSAPGMVFSGARLEATARICRILDGLPLAIELTTPLTRMFSPEKIAEMIQGNLDRIPEGPRDVHARHRSLVASMDWSYHLLAPADQRLYCMLSVFRPGAALEAVQAIVGNTAGNEHLRRISSLVDRSLVILEEKPDGEVYFRMLNTIREHAGMRLADSGLADEAARIHLEFYLGLVDRARQGYFSIQHPYWFLRIQAEQENLRAAFEYAFAAGRFDDCSRLVTGLMHYWRNLGEHKEGLEWAEAVLAQDPVLAEPLRAELLLAAGEFSLELRRPVASGEYLEEALEIFRKLGDNPGEAHCLIRLGLVELETSEDASEARRKIEGGLALFEMSSDMAGLAEAYNILGEVARYAGDFPFAEHCYRVCLEIAEEVGEQMRIATQFSNLGTLAYQRGDFRKADEFGRTALRLFAEIGAHYGVYYDIGGLAGAALSLDQPVRAAKLLAISSAGMGDRETQHQLADAGVIAGVLEETRRRLNPEVFQSAWDEGARMPIWEAFKFAIEG